jgi:hypothetical protein
MPEKKLPVEIDLSSKEVQTKIQDEIKNLLEEIRASVNVYPEDTPQHMQEHQIFQDDKPQEVRLKDYPNIQKLYKSFIVDYILKGGGRQLYEPRQIEQFLSGTKQFYEESTDLTTEGTFDVNIVNEFGFSSSPAKFKKFLKDLGIVGQSGFSRDLREILRYFTGTFEDTGLNPISAIYKGRNPELYDTLKSLPFLESVGEGRFIVKLLTRPEDNKTTFLDATDLVPVYEKFMGIKPRADRTLPEQMQHIEDMRGTGTVRSMIDPSQQTKPLETQEQGDIFRHLLDRFVEQENKSRQERQEKDPELTKRIEQRREHGKKVTFSPDPEEQEEIPEEELERIPVSTKGKQAPKKVGKPSATSPLAQKLRQRAAARLEVENEKARQRLGIQSDTEKVPTKKPDPKGGPKVPGGGPLFILDQLFRLVPGMGPVDVEGRPVAKLEEQMTKLTG